MSVNDEVKKILRDLSGKQNIYQGDSLQEVVGLDSLGLVLLLVSIEETFKIKLNESDMNPFDLKSVSDVIKLVKRYKEDSNEKS